MNPRPGHTVRRRCRTAGPVRVTRSGSIFVDRATIRVRSGKGGDGCVSFRREKYVPKGGPDGGDGGDGGSVILVATKSVDTLARFTGHHHWHADDGKPGRPAQCHGSNGQDMIIKVPAGTVVFDQDQDQLLVDLDASDNRYTVAHGGRGGFGNEHFASATNRTPRLATPGQPASQLTLRLELKLIADVGLIGKPNAGKSTLLSRLSNARPKIGAYPFTTLGPNLGVVQLPGERSLVLADLPGLIAGAADGSGLGHAFLRHVERTRVLVHLVEVLPVDGSDPAENFRTIQAELARYSRQLASKPQIVVASKVDLISEDQRASVLAALQAAAGSKLLAISAATGTGLKTLLERSWQAVEPAR